MNNLLEWVKDTYWAVRNSLTNEATILSNQQLLLKQGTQIMSKIDDLKTAVDGLKAAAETLIAQNDKTNAALAALIAGGTLSAADQATLQAALDEATATTAEVTADVAKNTPPAGP